MSIEHKRIIFSQPDEDHSQLGYGTLRNLQPGVVKQKQLGDNRPRVMHCGAMPKRDGDLLPTETGLELDNQVQMVTQQNYELSSQNL